MKENQFLEVLAEMAAEDGITVDQLLENVKADRINKTEQKKISDEINEFKELFPDTLPEDIPEQVWEKVAKGQSLTSAYAKHLCGVYSSDKKAHYVNEENGRRSAPAGKEADSEEAFTPEQVEGMSDENVKKNFKSIIRSLRNWKI